MPAITPADVGYAFHNQSFVAGTVPVVPSVLYFAGRGKRTVRVTFPLVNTLYVTGGIPIDGFNLGCPSRITSCQVVAKLAPRTAKMCHFWRWNGIGAGPAGPTGPTLVAFLVPADAGPAAVPMVELANGVAITANSQVLLLEVEGY